MTDTSQYGEGAFILEHFAGKVGNFLDIGAFDGKTFSNTWPLAQFGWSGVCVEPSPPAFVHLMQTYKDSDNIRLVNAALTHDYNHVKVFQANAVYLEAERVTAARMMSSLSTEHTAKFPDEVFREILVSAITWPTLQKALGIEYFHFVNIDVEGCNFEVFNAMPMQPEMQPEMVCIEGDPLPAVLAAVHARYPNVRQIGGNILGWL